MRILQFNIVPCHASTDVSCLPISLSAALRLQLHSGTMRLQARLAERKKCGATSRHLTHDRTLSRCLVLSVLFGAFLFKALLISPLVTQVGHAADKLPVHADKNKTRTIHINADRLISNIEDGWAEFTGNVCVTRKSLIIKSDSLKIYYKKLFKGQNKSATGQELIEKIIATGNIHIKSDELVAISNQAIYTKETGIIILSGPDSKVISKNNSIAGSQIILYMDEERIKVAGSSTNRVEAEFQGNKE